MTKDKGSQTVPSQCIGFCYFKKYSVGVAKASTRLTTWQEFIQNEIGAIL